MIFWLIVTLVLATFVVETAFVYCATCKRLLEMGLLPRDMLAAAYVWLVLGGLADVVFNLIRGTIEFREWPRWGEWTFSARVKRHVRTADDWRRIKADRWARLLNAIDPGHI